MMQQLFQPGAKFIFMKIGLHAQEPIEKIIERKRRELEDAGVIFWGYGGNTCHPATMVQPFAANAEAQGLDVYLIMHKMESKHYARPEAAKQYSEDGVNWKKIPDGVNVLGSRYALVLSDLKEDSYDVNLRDLRVAVGRSRGQRGDEYIRGHVDKACFEFAGVGAAQDPGPTKHLDLFARVAAPYAVFLK